MGQGPFNEEYIRKLAAGDPQTQRHFTTYFPAIMRVKLRSKLRSYQMFDDIRQETFVRVLDALRRPDGLQNPDRFGAFVNSVCNNVAMEMIRAENRYPQIPEDAPELIDEDIDLVDDLVTGERKRLVGIVLDALPDKDREILRKFYFEEIEKDVICKEMGVSPSYFRVLIHRAKAHFRSILKKNKNKSL